MHDCMNCHSLCRYLDLTTPKLTLTVGDIRDKEQCHLAMEGVSYVFHLAGRDLSSRASLKCVIVPALLMLTVASVCMYGRHVSCRAT